MTEAQNLPAENVFGIAKKLHLELEKLTLMDHGGVIAMLNTMAQRREMAEKLERQQAQQAANDAAMAEAQAAHERRTAQMNARLAEQTAKDAGIVLVGG